MPLGHRRQSPSSPYWPAVQFHPTWMRVDDMILVKQMIDKLMMELMMHLMMQLMIQLMIKLMIQLMMQLIVVKIKSMMKLIMKRTFVIVWLNLVKSPFIAVQMI